MRMFLLSQNKVTVFLGKILRRKALSPSRKKQNRVSLGREK
jgi:hypothetical protein